MAGKDLTLVSTIPAHVHVPLSGEAVRAADVEVAAQSLGNYCKALEDGAITVKSGYVLNVESGGSIVLQAGSGLGVFGRKRRRQRAFLAGTSNYTIDTTQADCWELYLAPAATRTITLRTSTAPVPLEGELIELVTHGTSLVTRTIYTIQREDGTPICNFEAVAVKPSSSVAQFEFSGGVWRLGLNSGWRDDGGPVGVIPLAGA